MFEIVVLSLSRLKVNPVQATRHVGPTRLQLTESIRQFGILQPPGVVRDGESYRVVWGNGRVVCGLDAGVTETRVALLKRDITEQEFLLLMGVENIHKQDWTNPQLTDYYADLAATGMSQKEIAQRLSVDEGTLSNHLTIARKASPTLFDAYRNGLEIKKTVFIARQPAEEHERLIGEAKATTGQGLVRKFRQPKPDTEKVNRLPIALSSGVTVVFSGRGLTLDAAIEAARDAERVLVKGQKDGLGSATIAKASKERAKALLTKTSNGELSS